MSGALRKVLIPALIEGNVDKVTKTLTEDADLSINCFIGDSVTGYGEFSEPTALTIATENGQIECVKKILELGGDLYSVGVDENDEDYRPNVFISRDYFGALVIAMSKGFKEIVHLLAEFRLFKISGIENDYMDFVAAAKDGDFTQIKTLLERVDNKDMFLKGWKGHNIMNLCLLHKCPSWCLQTMVDQGISAKGWDYNGLTPLMCAILAGNLECVQLLLDNGADPYDPHLQRRMSFRSDGDVVFVDDTGADISPSPEDLKDWLFLHQQYVGPTALMYAAAMGNIPILKLMLEKAPQDIPSYGRFEYLGGTGPLMYAIEYGNMEAVSLILKYEEARQDLYSCPISHAICTDNIELLQMLFESIPHSTLENHSVSMALVKCVHKKNPQLLERLLNYFEKGVFELDGGRALFMAMKDYVPKCVDVFVKRPGFSVDAVCSSNFSDGYKLTSLMYSSQIGSDEFVKMFLEIGANVNTVDKRGKTAIMYAVQENQVKCFQLLIDAEADLDIVDNKGGTVFSAALMGNGSCLELLLKTGKLLDDRHLKSVHKQSLKVFGQNEEKRAIACKNAYILIQYNLFEWNWCLLVNKKSLRSFTFAALTSGFSPGSFMYNGQSTSLLVYAILIKDVDMIRYLLANDYFTPRDYRFLLANDAIKDFMKSDDYPDLTFLLEQLTLQPLTLQTWSVLATTEAIASCHAVHNQRNIKVDSLPIPTILRNKLKFKNKFSELCHRHWAKLGPQKGENDNSRFDLLIASGDIIQSPSLVNCSQRSCACGKQGLTIKALEDDKDEGEDDDEDDEDYIDDDDDEETTEDENEEEMDDEEEREDEEVEDDDEEE